MSDTDIITLDSEEEEENDVTEGADLVVGPNGQAVPVHIIRRQQQAKPRLPMPPGIQINHLNLPHAYVGGKVPKKPGTIPPFNLFSQENRPKLLLENKDISFAEVGKRMGEMWHSLTEDEKKDYRIRAQEIARKNLRDWYTKMKEYPEQVTNEVTKVMAQKRRRTHGYAIFSSEMRKQFAEGVPLMDTTKLIAEKWRNISPTVRQSYESRAAAINETEGKKYQQLLLQTQRKQQQLQYQQQQQQQQQRQELQFRQRLQHQQQQLQRKQQQMAMYHQQQQQAIRARLYPGGQVNRQSLPNAGSGLRITSVSSLSAANRQPGINLPSSITVSRIEPEISIVEEEEDSFDDLAQRPNLPPGLSIQRTRTGPPPLTLGRSTTILARRPQQQAQRPTQQQQLQQLAFQQKQRLLMRQRHQQQLQQQLQQQQLSTAGFRPMKGIMGQSGFAVQRNMAPKRRMVIQGSISGASSNKQPRPAPGQVLKAALTQGSSIICRLCAQSSPFSQPLKDRPDTVEAINFCLDMDLDFEEDKKEAYPESVCRRCCTILSTFSLFKKSFEAGQIKLQEIIEAKSEERAKTVMSRTTIISEVDSSEMSILPDLDCEVEEGESSHPFPLSLSREEKQEEAAANATSIVIENFAEVEIKREFEDDITEDIDTFEENLETLEDGLEGDEESEEGLVLSPSAKKSRIEEIEDDMSGTGKTILSAKEDAGNLDSDSHAGDQETEIPNSHPESDDNEIEDQEEDLEHNPDETLDEHSNENYKETEDSVDEHSNNDHVEQAEPHSGAEENQDFNFDESFEIESDFENEDEDGESLEQSETVEAPENDDAESLSAKGEVIEEQEKCKDNNNELESASADPKPPLCITIKKKSLTIVNKSPTDDIEH